jgi:hypothetical protein
VPVALGGQGPLDDLVPEALLALHEGLVDLVVARVDGALHHAGPRRLAELAGIRHGLDPQQGRAAGGERQGEQEADSDAGEVDRGAGTCPGARDGESARGTHADGEAGEEK